MKALKGAQLILLKAYTPTFSQSTEVTLHHAGRAADFSLRAPTSVGSQLGVLAQLAVYAGFDYVRRDKTQVHASVMQDSCSNALDLVFLIDGSGSIETPWSGGEVGAFKSKVLKFVQEMVQYFTIGPNATRVGVATFSTKVTVNFELKDHSSSAGVQAAIQDIPYPKGQTYTSDGIKKVRKEMFTVEAGMRPLEQGVSRVAVIVTDGNANKGYEPEEEAKLLHKQGVNVFVIGVGTVVDSPQLGHMASPPLDRHVYSLRTMNAINYITGNLRKETCKEPAVVSSLSKTVSCTQRHTKNTFPQ